MCKQDGFPSDSPLQRHDARLFSLSFLSVLYLFILVILFVAVIYLADTTKTLYAQQDELFNRLDKIEAYIYQSEN